MGAVREVYEGWELGVKDADALKPGDVFHGAGRSAVVLRGLDVGSLEYRGYLLGYLERIVVVATDPEGKVVFVERKPPAWERSLAALNCDLSDVLVDVLPHPWASYKPEEQAAINDVRTAHGWPAFE